MKIATNNSSGPNPDGRRAHLKFLATVIAFAGAAALNLALPAAAHAATVTVAGVEIDSTAKVGSSTLVLNGAGKRTKYFFDVYVAGLYLTGRLGDAPAILGDPGPKRISMTLMRNLSAEQLSDALREGISLNSSPAELASLSAQIEALVDTMNAIGSAPKGARLTIDFLADGTTHVAINGQPRGNPIPGADFQRALLKVWLGAKPVQSDLKKALLGE
jgi:Chalcone isomerase-like